MTVFASRYAEQYDTMYAEKDYAKECDLVAAAASENGIEVGSVLDIGCGTGGHSLEWARRGVSSVGVDMSQAMIDIALAKAARCEFPVPPSFQTGDARNFEAGGPFDVATMMFAVLGYMTGNEDVAQALANVRRHLRPGGLFAFDVWYGPAVLSVRPESRVRLLDGGGGVQTIRVASTEIDSFNHLAKVTYQLWSVNGDRYLGTSEETHHMRFFFPQELSMLLATVGFELTSLTSFPDHAALTEETWNAFCVARAV